VSIVCALVLTLAALATSCGGAAPRRTVAADRQRTSPAPEGHVASFLAGDLRLRVEALAPDLVHFEVSSARADERSPIPASRMVHRRSVPIAWSVREATVLATEELRVEIDPASLCVRVTDLVRGFPLHRACPRGAARLTFTREGTENVYGLGAQFVTAGTPDGDWMGRSRTPGNEHGNAMVEFDGGPSGSGSVGNAQFPVLYAAGKGRESYAMFVDDPYAERWSFEQDPWTLDSTGEELRWYVMAGPDLQDLRRDVMRLLGRPPVPPRKMFGLWISEYGYDDWSELEDKLRTLRAHHFPVDGFVLDLQWFGGITPDSDESPMGTLTWDRERFPDPERKIAELRDREGIGLVLIEESYVSRGLPEHAELERRGFLARDCPTCPATYISWKPWWGKGGMIDWTNPEAGAYWHDTKRKPLVDMGILGHWCDLGEPEMYSATSVYAGVSGRRRHVDIHNLFSFAWIESIARGYERQGTERRPFMMARSGAPGLQRFGASMWSGDIGSNLSSLAAHLDVQKHMSMSGIDYFGADIGGFIREALRGDLDEMYTQWFADGMAIDVPGRVHAKNTDNAHETAPDRVGHRPSNLASVRRRYELVPYVYSLAHRAFRSGDPVFPPLVWAHQEDTEARRLGGEKLIGRDVLVALVARDGARTHDVYLPPGAWFDLEGTKRHTGGAWLRGLALYDQSKTFRLPMFARAGAIVPLSHVDDQTWNVMGKRGDGTRKDDLRVRVFAGGSPDPTRFTLYEDDGETIKYQQGEVRATEITQRTDAAEKRVTVEIGAAKGTFAGALSTRGVVVEIVLPDALKPKSVVVDGRPAQRTATPRPGLVVVAADPAPVTIARSITVTW
jgi:alpha-glucosidase (family GH31 glycosyl hydrolase)